MDHNKRGCTRRRILSWGRWLIGRIPNFGRWLIVTILVILLGYFIPRWYERSHPKVPQPIVACEGVVSENTGVAEPRFLVSATYIVKNAGEKETDDLLLSIRTPGKIVQVSPELNRVDDKQDPTQVKFKLKIAPHQEAPLKVTFGFIQAVSVPPKLEGVDRPPSVERRDPCF